MKTFFQRIGAFFKKVFANSTVENEIITAMKVAGPMIAGVVGMCEGEAAQAEITSVVNEVVTDFAAACTLTQEVQAGTAPGGMASVQNILQDAQSNLGTLLTAGHIKNTATLQKVSITVNSVIGSIQGLLSSLSTVAAGAKTAPVAAPAPAK